MQGLVAVEEEVPRCQIQTHVSVCGCHIRLSAADKIQQIAEVEEEEVAPSLPCTPLLLLILHVIGLCARRVQLFVFFDGVFKSGHLQFQQDVQWCERFGTAVCRPEFRCNFQTEAVVNSRGAG